MQTTNNNNSNFVFYTFDHKRSVDSISYIVNKKTFNTYLKQNEEFSSA